jgi:uncharacterized protein (UPF0332 family)
MTDLNALFNYRWEQAKTTLTDAQKMAEQGLSPRSIINRAYYAMFYATLALFLKTGVSVSTSKHAGVLGIFDKEFILTGKIPKEYSKMLHVAFDDRQEFDYKEFAEVDNKDALDSVENAKLYIIALEKFVNNEPFNFAC